MKNYSASDIKVLKGLDAVRKRPGMYIGDTDDGSGLHHMLFEVLDNSVDEALAGYCDVIEVEINNDQSVSIKDNGRGIPTEIHPIEKKPTLELVLTELHAGGKFDQNSYSVSGGLHGVGVSVVNALSSWLRVEVYKPKSTYSMEFNDGIVTKPLSYVRQKNKTTGTKVIFKASSSIFSEVVYDEKLVSNRLRDISYLNPNLRIIFRDNRIPNSGDQVFHSKVGIVDFLDHISSKPSLLKNSIIINSNNESFDIKNLISVDIAFTWLDSYSEKCLCFTNNIPQIDGGAHLSAFRNGLTRSINSYLSSAGIKQKNKIQSEDIREGLCAIISIKLADPKFSSQTKEKLVSSEVSNPITNLIVQQMNLWLESNKLEAKKIINKIQQSASTREASRKARELSRSKNILDLSVLPGKLANCQSKKPEECELFIVEGDSAGGTAKQGRDKYNQAVLPLRGKVLNVERSNLDKIIKSEQIGTLVSALGCGIGENFSIEKLRYHKIIIMTDADVDGSHIKTLLLTFFHRYLPKLIKNGYVYVAQPPLYSISSGKNKRYFLDTDKLYYFFINNFLKSMQLKVNNKKLSIHEADKFISTLLEIIPDLKKFYSIVEDNRVASAIIVSGALHPKAYSSDLFKQKTLDYILSILKAQYPMFSWNGSITPDHLDIYYSDTHLKYHSLIPYSLYNTTFSGSLLKNYKFLSQYFLKGVSITPGNNEVYYDPVHFFDFVIAMGSKGFNMQRYKGLGEMNKDQLWDTTMSPSNRTLLKVNIEDLDRTNELFSILMGNDVEIRKDYISNNALNITNLDI